jgi:cell wall-associated NlpC family hydrolase
MKPYFDNDNVWKDFMAIVKTWEGTPYRHLAMVKGGGADCSLFIAACWLEAGILKEVKYDYYPRDWHIHDKKELVVNGLYRHFRNHVMPGFDIIKMTTDEAKQRGDMLTFATTGTGLSNHASIYLQGGMMVHSIPNRGVSYFPFKGFFERKYTCLFRITKR